MTSVELRGSEDIPEGVGLSESQITDRVTQVRVLIDQMAPMVAMDGGELLLMSVDAVAGEVVVQLRGACSSCAISGATLEAGVGRILRDRLAWVREVHGSVDETYDFEDSMEMGTGAYVPRYRD